MLAFILLQFHLSKLPITQAQEFMGDRSPAVLSMIPTDEPIDYSEENLEFTSFDSNESDDSINRR